MTDTQPRLLTVEEAAVLLRRHPTTLRVNLRDGDVPGVRIGKRWFLSTAVLDRILAGEQVTNGGRTDTVPSK